MLSLFPVKLQMFHSHVKHGGLVLKPTLKKNIVKKEKLYCFQCNESTISKRTGFNLQYS